MKRDEANILVQRLFNGFGKYKVNENHFNVYLNWAVRYSEEVIKEVISQVLDAEDKMPTRSALNKLAKRIRGVKAQVEIEDEECFYCGSPGFVPVLFRPNEMSSVPYMRNYSCKCTRGDNKATIEVHGEQKHFTDACFDKFPELQFEHRLHEFPNMNYPQIVDQIKILLA